MKLTIVMFLSFLSISNSFSATCVCAQSSKKHFDRAKFTKCVGSFSQTSLDDDSNLNCDASDLGEADQALCNARRALDRVESVNRDACTTLATTRMSDLVFLAEGQKITLETFNSKEECNKEIRVSKDCR